MAENIKRDILVCLRHKCNKCKKIEKIIPLSCEYDILHLLGSERGGLCDRARQSGKTKELVKMANELCELGYPVYFICKTMLMAERVRNLMGLDRRVRLFSLGSSRRGFAPGYILCDDLNKEEVEAVEGEMIGSILVAAYYTKHG